MKLRLLLAVAGWAIGLALPTFAHEQKTVDPEIRQQIEGVNKQLGEASNKHDAAAVAALFTLEAIRVLDFTGGPPLVGREAIEKDFAANFASSPPDVVFKLVQMYTIGDEIADISEWSAGRYWGYSLKVYVRDADTWKIRMEYVTLSAIPR
jgi:uncharacterized protein (TIGR02246 family)